MDVHAHERRTVLAQFTCDQCGTRSERNVNPAALKRGTVYVQCQGCDAWHTLVDNLDLVKEYDLKAEREADAAAAAAEAEAEAESETGDAEQI